jgi:hypothetical protein
MACAWPNIHWCGIRRRRISYVPFHGLIESVKPAADSRWWDDAGVRSGVDDLVVSRVSGCGTVFLVPY